MISWGADEDILEYVDDGVSGTHFKRQGFQQLQDDMKSGEIGCVVIKDFSRFGRDYLEVGFYIEYIFPLLQIRFISIDDSYDSVASSGMTSGMKVALQTRTRNGTRLAKFASDIWQIHPFCEGNTRATAVFIIKYMKTFGFKVNNDAFEKNSWYFRNALVRANYNDLQNSVHATTKFLEMFFSNLILGTEYELKNRYMHVGYVDDNSQSVTLKAPKSQFDTLECTLEELAFLELIYKNPSIKQKNLVAETGKSLSTVKRIMESLQKKEYIRRVNGKRYGKWEILI